VDLFGLRATHSIKVVIACLASSADPRDRTDYQMIQHFRDMGVPPENLTVLLEQQATVQVTLAAIQSAAKSCGTPGQVLFVYAGSRGSAQGGTFTLSLHDGWLFSAPVLRALARAHSGTQVVLCVDSAFAGQMIRDFQRIYGGAMAAAAASMQHAAADRRGQADEVPGSRAAPIVEERAVSAGMPLPSPADIIASQTLPSITIITSSAHNTTARSGWRFVNIINDMLVTPLTRSSPERFAEHMVAKLKTPMANQRAQAFHHRHPLHANYHRYYSHQNAHAAAEQKEQQQLWHSAPAAGLIEPASDAVPLVSNGLDTAAASSAAPLARTDHEPVSSSQRATSMHVAGLDAL